MASSHILVQRKALREPEGAVFTLAPGHHDAQDENDQQEDGAGGQQRQQWHTWLWQLQRLPCRQEMGDFNYSPGLPHHGSPI